jgi:hypothetical protein
MSLGSLTLLISRECDTYYKKRDSRKLNHRVDALRYLHFRLIVKERGAPVRPCDQHRVRQERIAHHTGR